MIASRFRRGFIGKEHPLLGVQRAVIQGSAGDLAVEATVAALLTVTTEGTGCGADNWGAVGSDERVLFFD